MKYFLIFLFCLLSLVACAQYPTVQYLGAPKTLILTRGGLQADSSLILPVFADTATANLSPYIKTYPGNLIRVANKVWMRNNDATAWISIGGGGNTTASNGLTKVGDDIQLGGTINQATTISMPFNTLQVDGLLPQSGTLLYLNPGFVQIGQGDPTAFGRNEFNTIGNGAVLKSKNPTKETTLQTKFSGVYISPNDSIVNIDKLKVATDTTNRKQVLWNSSTNNLEVSNISSTSNTLANNGLSKIGDTIQLGGSLTKNTTITGTQKELKLDSIDFQIRDDSLFRRFNVTNSDINTGQKENYLGVLYSRDINLDPVPKHEIWISQTPGTGNLIAAQGYGQETDSYIRVDTSIIKIQVPDGNLQVKGLQGTVADTLRPIMYDPLTDKVYQYVDPYNWNVDTSLYVKYTDTSAMLQPYYKAADTVNLRRVTSVGLTMPSAFQVTNTPITTSGTINVTGAGTSSQYIKGDGSLANFPNITTSGGASINYYLNGSVNQGTFAGNTYYQLDRTPVIGTGTDFSLNADGVIARFITNAGNPALLNIPAGNFIFLNYFSASSAGGTPQFYINLYKYNGTTFSLISSNSANPETITSGTAIDLYYTALAVPQTTLTLTDRLAIEIYVIHDGRTITLHTEDSHLSEIQTTFSTGITALNGATESVQYLAVGTAGSDFNISSNTNTHTFNLPTASASNRGALSTSDWTNFNNKLNPSDTVSLSNRINDKQNLVTLTTTGTSGASTFNQSTGALNIPNYTTDTTSLSNRINAKQDQLNGTGFVKASGTTITYDNTTYQPAITPGSISSTTTGVTIGNGPNSTVGPNVTVNIASASTTQAGLLSSANFNTFNNKQDTLKLTTTGTTGAATYNPATETLNIPQYGGSGGSGFGYTLLLGHNSTSFTASQTWVSGAFYGSNAIELFNNRPSRWILAPKNGTIVSASIISQLNATTYASPSSTVVTIRINNLTQGTSSVIDNAYPFGSSLTWTGSPPAKNNFYTLANPLSVNQGDQIQVQIVTPAWTSAPAAMSQNFLLFVE